MGERMRERAAQWLYEHGVSTDWEDAYSVGHLLEIVQAEEREACARLVREHAETDASGNLLRITTPNDLLCAIRARGERETSDG